MADGTDEIAALRARNAELEAVVSRLIVENRALSDRVAALEAELGRTSDNSSKPPSADPVATRKSRAERRAEARKAGRAQGKQPGAPGATLARRTPEVTVVHRPVCCSGCGADLAEATRTGEVCRQVLDLPAIRLVVTDHIGERRRCRCGTETVAVFPTAARAPVCWGPEVRALAVYLMDRQHLPLERCAELLAELVDAPVSTGWLCAVQQEAAGRLAPFVTAVKDALGDSPVVCADETGTRVGITKRWVHTLATNLLTLLVVHPRRGVDALEDIGVLASFTGVIVHDGWTPYERYDQALHAQCGAHLLRHLAAVGETPAFSAWTTQLTAILLEAKLASETAADAGQPKVPARKANSIRRHYHDTLALALALLPSGPPPRRRHQGHWNIHQRAAWNLATRMRDDADQVLRLLDDTRVPFTNNTAERALRPTKLHDKISGTFRSDDGAAAFATIRSYLQTVALNGHNRLEALNQLFTTGPWLPQSAGGT